MGVKWRMLFWLFEYIRLEYFLIILFLFVVEWCCLCWIIRGKNKYGLGLNVMDFILVVGDNFFNNIGDYFIVFLKYKILKVSGNYIVV